eukprot:TRINITY_DN1288_c0_g2_i1.p1 TRINITY_DN1288_c0_g2~~TRINITY_DN1288_c0_g2_i1.p1  ORF type:complete len:433 (+),score=72.50 TRINITY_DN1288_c0_g2_i1:41-1300(+)
MQYNPDLYLKLGKEGRENPRHLGAMAAGTLSIHNMGKVGNEGDNGFYKDGTTGYTDHSAKGKQMTADDFMLMSAASTVGGQRAVAPNNSFPPPQSATMKQPPPQHQYRSVGGNYGSPAGYPPPPQDRMTAQEFASQLQSGYGGGGGGGGGGQQRSYQQPQPQYQQSQPQYQQQSQRPLSAQEFASQLKRSQNYKQPPQHYASPPVQSYRPPPSEGGYSDRSSSRQSGNQMRGTQTNRIGMQITPTDNLEMYGGTVKSRYPNCDLNRVPGETDTRDAGYMMTDEYGNPIAGQQPHSYAPDGTPLDRYGNPIPNNGNSGSGRWGNSNSRGGPGSPGRNDRPGKGMSIYGKKAGSNNNVDGRQYSNSALTRPAGGFSGVSHYRVGEYRPEIEDPQAPEKEEPQVKLDSPFGMPNQPEPTQRK